MYYDYISQRTYQGTAKGRNVTVSATLDRTPLLIRGGSIIPTRQRPRRSSSLMKRDPITLRIALDNTGFAARGKLYLDDGESYAYEKGDLIWREFTSQKAGKAGLRIASRDLAAAKPAEAVEGGALAAYDGGNAYAKSVEGVVVERIVVLGLAAEPKSVALEGGAPLEFEYTKGVAATDKKDTTRMASTLTIKGRGLSVARDWVIVVS